MDEAVLVFRHALKVVPPEWANVDQLWFHLALVLIDRGDAADGVLELAKALEAAHTFATSSRLTAPATTTTTTDDDDNDHSQKNQKSKKTEKEKKKKKAENKLGNIFRTTAPEGGDERGGESAVADTTTMMMRVGEPLHVGPGHYPPPWWHQVVHVLGDAMVKAKADYDDCDDHENGDFFDQKRRRRSSPPKKLNFAAILRHCGRFLPPDPMLRAEMGRTMLRLGLVDQGAAELQAALDLGDVLFGGGGSGSGNADNSHRPNGRRRGSRSGGGGGGSSGGPRWPGRAMVLHGLGSAHGINGETDKSIVLFRASLAAEPDNPNAAATRFLLARSLAETGEERAALDELDTAVGAGLWVNEALLKGSAFEEIQDHPRFLSIMKRMAKNGPGSGGGRG
jgi:tetratricopeptide (TPR) repeat protein